MRDAILGLLAAALIMGLPAGCTPNDGLVLDSYARSQAATLFTLAEMDTTLVPPTKVKRSECTECDGTGRIRTGDGISWTECDNCYDDSGSLVSYQRDCPGGVCTPESAPRPADCPCGPVCPCEPDANCGSADCPVVAAPPAEAKRVPYGSTRSSRGLQLRRGRPVRNGLIVTGRILKRLRPRNWCRRCR